MKILVTAFDAFGGEETNAVQEVLAALPDSANGVELQKLRPDGVRPRCKDRH